MMKAFLLAGLALIALAGVHPARGQEFPGLFEIQRDGTGLREIGKLPAGVVQVKLSPDGLKLVMSAFFEDLPRPHCFAIAGLPPSNGKIFLMNTDGSNLHEVGGYSSGFEPTFTADSQRILFTAYDASAGTCVDKLLGIYSINLDGTDAKLIVPDAIDAGVSSDGSKFLYRKAAGLYVSDADGSNEKLISNSVYENAVFNPTDSSEIMVVNTVCSTIFTVDLSTGVRNVLLHGPINRRAGVVLTIEGANYSPDANAIVYSAVISDSRPDGVNDYRGYLRHSEIYELNTSNGSIRRVTDNVFKDKPADPSDPNGYTQVYAPLYSPDGKSILFLASRSSRDHSR
ncbi:MAG TPA: hypothetical protein VMF66_10055 [Candidatus Acidoferrum sp.]|nr:hypothetical protein [Candidatus Acidoferrum sp.]